MPAKVLLVSWESAERTLVERLLRDGRLPTLAHLREAGAWREIDAPRGLGDDAAWASFCTGADVAGHRRCYWQRIAPGGHDLRYHPRNDGPIAPFWERLASRGARVAVIDVPSLTGAGHDALVVSNWTAHAVEGTDVHVSVPECVVPLVRDPAWACDGIGPDAGATRELGRSLAARSSRRRDVLLPLLAEEDWDLFVVVASEPHCVGHQRWHDREPVEAVYELADSDLHDCLVAAGPEATVVVFSLLGMGPNHSGEHLLDDVLLRLDGARARPSLGLRIVRTARGFVPERVRARAPSAARESHRRAVTRDRARRSAWVLPTDLTTSAVRIGVQGRDDGGTVPPAARRNRCARLADDLRALVDPDTGRPVVDDVVDVEAVHGTEVADGFADLLVVWSRDAPITAASSAAVGTVRAAPPTMRTGNHRTEGWMVMAGPAVASTTAPGRVEPRHFAALVDALLAPATR